MKKFIIINGTDILFKKFKDMEDARQYAINFCDHSEGVVVREFKIVVGYVVRNIKAINEQIVELRDSDTHLCEADANDGDGHCSCNEYDVVRDELHNIFELE